MRLFLYVLQAVKYFNALINNKPFFDQPVKSKQEAYEKLIEMSRNNDSAMGNVSDYLYQKYCRGIGIDLSRQANMTIPQQINFVGKLKENDATIFFVAEKQQKTIVNFSLDSLIVTE